MCGTLDQYLLSFSKIRVDRTTGSWTNLTNRVSPYKPFLLLSILDSIASGQITKNFIEPSFELTETFQGYIALLPNNDRKASMSYPFYHLESSGFWEMASLVRLALKYQPSTRALLGAILTDLGKAKLTDKLKNSLNPITTYTLPGILDVCLTTQEWNFR